MIPPRDFSTLAASEILSPAERTLRELLIREVADPGRFVDHPDFGNVVVDPVRPPRGPVVEPPASAPTAPTAPTTRAPIDFIHVQPGDLITAGFVNGLIDVVHLLDLRLIALEAAEAAPTRANG